MPKVYVYDDESPTYYIRTEKPTGFATDEIELVYMQDGSPYSISIDSFKRV